VLEIDKKFSELLKSNVNEEIEFCLLSGYELMNENEKQIQFSLEEILLWKKAHQNMCLHFEFSAFKEKVN